VYSDHASDAPLMDWAHAAYLVNPSAKLRKLAAQKNWQVRDFSSAEGH
jgi:phosphoserine phosphatase